MNDYSNKKFVYLGWTCNIYLIDVTWYFKVLNPNGKWKTQGNAFGEAEATLRVFVAVTGLGEYKE